MVDQAEQSRIRLGAWVRRYFTLRGTRLKPATRVVYGQAGALMVAHWGQDREIARISRLEVAEFRAWLGTGRGNGSARNEQTVCKLVAACASILREACRLDLIGFNPFDRESTARPRVARDWRYVTDQELGRILELCPSDNWRCAFALCRWAGLRIGEALRLRWSEIDWAERRILVMPEGGVEGTKQARRLVPIQPALYAVLEPALAWAPAGQGGPCDGLPPALYRHGQAIVRAAGLTPWDKLFHDLRRNLVTDWQARFPPLDVAAWCGHDVRVAAAHYHQTRGDIWVRVTVA